MPKIVYEAPEAKNFELIPTGTPLVVQVEKAEFAQGIDKNGKPWYRVQTTNVVTDAEDESLVKRKIWETFWLPRDMPTLNNILSVNDMEPYAEGEELDTDELIDNLKGAKFATRAAIVVEKRNENETDSYGNVSKKEKQVEVNRLQRQDVKWNPQVLVYNEYDFDSLVAGIQPQDAMPF